ncbi:ShlB/FhaC/HecB family hemolysin secretion/activation protein [bacterium]|nr:ShlB/FhaC/HecB family hemolysin secretion/activation protein [bacterium]
MIQRCVLASSLLLLFVPWAAFAQNPDTLQVTRFQLEGNTLVSEAELASVLRPYQGQRLTLAEIKEVAEAVTQYHISHGFKLAHTYVPEQDFANGVVRLQVFEGKIEQLKVVGNEYRDSEMLKSYFQSTLDSNQYREEEVIRSVLLVNDLPDVKAKVRLEKGQSKGTTDLILEVEDRHPLAGWLSYNNYGSQALGEHRLGLTVADQDLSGVGDRLAVSGLYGFPSSGSNFYIDAGYTRPLNTEGTRLNLGYTNSAFALGDQFQILDVRGNADIFRLGLEQALERSLTHRSDLAFYLSSNSIRNSLLGQPFSRDEYIKANLGYSGLWLDVDGQTFFSASVSQGFRSSPLSLASRVGVGSNFTHVNLDALRIQSLSSQFRWSGRGMAQFAFSPLVTAEQFSLGGPYTVRGYAQGEYLADSAYVFSSEFRFSPLEDDPQMLEFLAFVDYGHGNLKQPQAGEFGSRSFLGAGLGLRLNWNRDVQARLDLGFPLSPTTNSRGQSPMIYGGLQTRLW